MSEYNNTQFLLLPEAYQTGSMIAAKPVDDSCNVPVVRSSSAYRRNSLGIYEKMAVNVPLLEFPSAGCPSWLINITRTNYCLYSMDFSNSIWQAGGPNCAKSLSASSSNISGKQAYDITGLNTYGGDFFYQNLSQNANSVYSVFIKAKVIGDVGKTITFITGNGSSVQIILTSDYVKWDLFSASSESYFYITKGNSGTPATQCTISYIGVEIGAYSTNPIETTNASVTVVYPSSTITTLITKGIFNSTGGTFFIKLKNVKYVNGGIGIRIGNTSTGFGVELGGSADNKLYLWYTTTGSASETAIGVTPIATTLSLCITITATQLLIYCNGALIFTVNGTFATSDLANVVLDGSAFGYLLDKFSIRPIVITGIEAIALTNQ
mgnify:CR=1 FL=1